MTEIPKPVLDYVEEIESGRYRVSKEIAALAKYLRRVFGEEDLFCDDELFENYMRLEKYFPFRLFPWERAQLYLWDCVFTRDGLPRWQTVFNLLARGAGKDGLIAFDSLCMVSPYNPVRFYNVDICATCYDQATQPVTDAVAVLESPKQAEKLKRFFRHTKECVRGIKNGGEVNAYTKSPNTKDGLRTSKAIFNEVHAYTNYDNISVFTTGLGKKEHSRIGIFSSNGRISDGPLDDYDDRGQRILFEEEPDRGFLPFICRLEKVEQVHDFENWTMANPSILYNSALRAECEREYWEWKDKPETNPDFIIKRFGIREGADEFSVTAYENILATKRELPDMSGWSCVVGVDYAELSDWASVDLHFRRGNDRFDISHSWMCLKSKTLSRLKVPWREWTAAGMITAVDDVSISPDLLTEYIKQSAAKYNIKRVGMDHYRWTLVAESFARIGFDARDKTRVKLIRPQDIMQVDPIIQDCFDRHFFTWGNCPPLRWAANNVKRVQSSKKIGVQTGNFIYAKIEPKSRKTDPFMALTAAMCCEEVLGTGETVSVDIGAITI